MILARCVRGTAAGCGARCACAARLAARHRSDLAIGTQLADEGRWADFTAECRDSPRDSQRFLGEVTAQPAAEITAERDEAAPNIPGELAREDEHRGVVHRILVHLDATAGREQRLSQRHSTRPMKFETGVRAGLVDGTDVRRQVRAS